ncbi:SDR family NAD(P)-dependent oxidoreductase [Micromonospora sp. NPDC000089]|uniref:SDR family NAD(P)-dependent oxidoreductase n=1 Tax=unclassified Micromonospora TaxID=2617518 RepID=UPI0036950BDE
MTGTDAPIAVVTGANRGIGHEVARQLAHRGYSVIPGVRDPATGERLLRELGSGPAPALDVSDDRSVEEFAGWLRDRHARLNVLVNNAGVHYDTNQRAVDADLRIVHEALEVNLLGAWRTCRALVPLMRAGARIVNVSSGAGSFGETDGAAGAPAYSVSKAALNMLTVKLAADLHARDIAVNAVCPGWVATDMGGHGGRPVSEGAAGIVWAATLPADGPTGGFFRDGRRIAW